MKNMGRVGDLANKVYFGAATWQQVSTKIN